MGQSNLKSQGSVPKDQSMECYAQKLGVAGESVGEIDRQTLQGLRERFRNLLLVDEEEGVFRLFPIRGRESSAYFSKLDVFPYLLHLDIKDPTDPNSPLKVVEVLVAPGDSGSAGARKGE